MAARPVFIGALVAALGVAGAGIWISLPRPEHTQPVPAAAEAPGSAEPNPADQRLAAASEPAASAADAAQEQLGESADSATGLERLLERQSVARANGLHEARDKLGLDASAALVMDAASREIVYGKNDAAVLPIASITKLMTGMVILDGKQPLDEVLEITEDDVDQQRHSRSRLRVGTRLTRGEALHLALMSSENRAAHALGRNFPGGLPAFVAAMNRKAQQVGMTQTRYVDPTGLSSDNRSTPRDLAQAVLAASNYPVLRDFSTTPQRRVELAGRTLQYNNSDRLVKNPKWDIRLQKTGYIVEAGHCVVMRTHVGKRDVVIVLLDAASNGRRSADAGRIRQWVEAGMPDPDRYAASGGRRDS